MEPNPGPVPDPDLAVQADLAATHDHDQEDATARHEQIASALWVALRQLGVTGGQMLILGEDPEVYAGLPATERRIPHGTTAELTAPVPSTRWPHTGLPLRRPLNLDPDPFDVVIDNIPSNDMVLRSTEASEKHLEYQQLHVLGAIGLTRPGGIIALLASSRLLDHPDQRTRLQMEGAVDLLGAVRLPAGALRRTPGNDGPVDLLLMLRTWPVTTTFADSWPVTLDGTTVHLAEYFNDHPEHVLGTLTSQTNPWGSPTTTVVPHPGDLLPQLQAALNDITSSAHTRKLITQPAAADLDAPIGYSITEPETQIPRVNAERPVGELDEARAVVGRRRAQRRSTRPTTSSDPAQRARETHGDPETPGL
ncbi:hypothetical protein C8K30_115117 [Promicromonospora sp. AC04]|uniref:hypothetical protein n=1 Tax=Promicromonospora sp. AC04 TaxID=2135723 RepID=UPI000D43844E|nr:hypothetical protein [Promicromonospora sp. AC04]PUB20906.1 hypothetical protein C8K30_115117 [Promicromonospora sp. AC04]